MLALIADDHPLYREGLSLLLKDIETDVEVMEAADFSAVFEQVSKSEVAIDVVFLDLDMPGMNWRQALGDLLAKELRVVVISGVTNPDIIGEVVSMGAAGFIPKDCSGKVMRGALRLIFSGGAYLPPSVLKRSSSQRPISLPLISGKGLGEPSYALTRRQKDVLSRMASGQSNKEIARDLELAEGTVKLHVTAILKSLGANNRTQAVMIAWQSGILTEGQALPLQPSPRFGVPS